MKKIIYLLIVGAMSSFVSGQVILTPVQDRDVYQGTGLPTSTPYSLGVSSSVAFGGGHSQKSLVQFDVTETSTGMTAEEVGSAKLRLYVLSPEVYPSGETIGGDLQVYLQQTAWTSTNLFWNSFSPGAFVNTLTLTADHDLGDGWGTWVYPIDIWVEVDVTSAVKSWLAGTDPNYGFILSPDETGSPTLSSVFAASNTGFKPELVITEAAPPELKITDFSFDGVKVNLAWNSKNGTSYVVRESPDLVNWTDRFTVTATGAATSAVFDGTIYPEKKAFYIVVQLP
jgi:hypothetical protein